jgi:hypothetical protein
MLTALCLVPLAIGCTSATGKAVDFSPRPTVGLANAPALYGSAPANDQRQHDVVANGLESCGRYLENGVLRYQWPPCPAPQATLVSPATVQPLATVQPPSPSAKASAPASAASATPWPEKFVVEWPCSHRLLDEAEALAIVACTVPEP